MDRLRLLRARQSFVALVAVTMAFLTACSSSDPAPEPTPLPAVCTALPDDIVRVAVDGAADANVERNRDDGETECRYVVDGGRVALWVTLIQTDLEPDTYFADRVANLAQGCEVLEDIRAVYCAPGTSSGASVDVVAGDQVVSVWHSFGYTIDDAQSRLTEVAAYISSHPEAFDS